MSAHHTPGRQCDECEGFCLQPMAGIEMSIRIGQRFRHRDHRGQRVTGVVRGLSLDSDDVLRVDLVLDAPIVIQAIGPDDRAVDIWRQCVPAHELTPFDERDELMAELMAALQPFAARNSSEETITITVRTADVTRARAAIAATGESS